ncbi:MAG: serine hydrolase domain-containing protein [Acidobacteriota bacterium]
MDWSHSTSLADYLTSSDVLRSVSAIAVAVREGGRWKWAGRSEVGSIRDDTTFDLASLTKPLMATLAVELDREGRFSLDCPVRDLWPDAPTLATAGDLLRHRSGLVAWLPFYSLCAAGRSRSRSGPEFRRDCVFDVLEGAEQWSVPGRLYSDLGYLLWGVLAERALGEDLRQIWSSSSTAHSELGYGPGSDHRPSPIGTAQEVLLGEGLGVALEDLGPPRGGEPQDGNARFLGPTAHAGLFGSIRALSEWLEATWVAPTEALRRSGIEDLDRPEAGGHWFRPALSSSCGSSVSAVSFGHTGFVGGAVWIDPMEGRAAVCLANRRSPTDSIRDSRRRLFTDVLSPQAGW